MVAEHKKQLQSEQQQRGQQKKEHATRASTTTSAVPMKTRKITKSPYYKRSRQHSTSTKIKKALTQSKPDNKNESENTHVTKEVVVNLNDDIMKVISNNVENIKMKIKKRRLTSPRILEYNSLRSDDEHFKTVNNLCIQMLCFLS